MLAALVQAGILGVDGKEFACLEKCPSCGGEVSGYDVKERKFAVIKEDEMMKTVKVRVKRFSCRECSLVSPAIAPFYPDTRMGSPIVDLCLILSREMPASRVARILEDFSLVVDRGTVRNYARRDFGVIPVTGVYGFSIPQSLMALSLMGMQAP